MRSYQFLKEKRGLGPGDIGHWVISPPQGFTKAMVQDDHHYMMLGRHITDPLQSIGCKAGSLYSIRGDWVRTTDTFRSNNPDWIIKKVHADAKVESIGQTAAYLLTHCGLGLSERNIDDIDWVEVRRCPHCGTDMRTYEGVVIYVVRSPHIRIMTISERSRNN
ncbi:MAG: hypothetical protein PUK31_00010 [Candidatus Methanomethylophilaceae archaeon]|nr:hypothetical protein [Candidatus Methanomethylophilaceae archaeon]MDY5872049.1 hypothetical protein [Candidatus Methanomethylophilaceae archaeon]